MDEEAARKHLSPEILRIIDSIDGIKYEEMVPGQGLIIYAEDAETKQPSYFVVEVLSVRPSDNNKDLKTATLRYKGDNFSFYNGEDPQAKPIRLAPGTLMENGISGTFIPQRDIRMSYLGGIGLTRDHSFEYIDGEPQSVVVHNLKGIGVSKPPSDFKEPNLKEYFEKIKVSRAKQEEERKIFSEKNEEWVTAFIEEKFKGHPMLDQIKEMVASFSPNGKITTASYLAYALEDGVFEKAWKILEEAYSNHYIYQHPEIRGDCNILATNRAKLMEMTRKAGIKWPRPEKEIKVIILKTDRELRAKLERKLDEYKRRFKEDDPALVQDARHKAMILEKVLKNGRVNVNEIKGEMKSLSWFDDDDFDNAVDVINEYCEVGGRGKLHGGTGLN
jgi:hypothetical protein